MSETEGNGEMRAVTVYELEVMCELLTREGKGDMQVLLFTDDEGNGLRPLYNNFVSGKEVDTWMKVSRMSAWDDGKYSSKNAVLLG